MSGLILAVVKFPQGAQPGEVDPTVIDHLAYWYVPGVLLAYGLGVVCIGFYGIDRAGHEENLRRLERRRVTGPGPDSEAGLASGSTHHTRERPAATPQAARLEP